MNKPVLNVENAAAQAPPTPGAQHAYDVFNGDADGICALHQLRLASPKDAALITGVKRDIALLKKIPCEDGADVSVLDISLDVNVEPLRRIIDAGGQVLYFDHHSAQLAFQHPRLRLHWDDSPDACTSILVDRDLQGRFRNWAIVAAFGDNLPGSARALAATVDMDLPRLEALEMLGRVLNYNAYGEQIEDLHMAPDALYRAIQPFVDPLDFIQVSPHYRALVDGYHSDTAFVQNLQPQWRSAGGEIYILPGTPWARRISGVFANMLASQGGEQSFAILTPGTNNTYVVSVRSGQPALRAANGFCARFATGGGRKSAAGINALPASELDDFARQFSDYFDAGTLMPAGGTHEC